MCSLAPRFLVSLLSCLLISPLAGCSTAPKFSENASLDEKIRATRQHLESPGLAAAVINDGEVVLQRAYGMANLETGEPLTLDHHFRIASITKPIVALAVLRLAERGELSLDDAVGQYLPNVPGGEQITLRMLGNHTSGLRNYIGLPDVKQAFADEPQRAYSVGEVLSMAYEAGPHFEPPGDGWMYSNTNYILLGQVLERVTGKPLDAALREVVLEPLGMSNTFYSVEPTLPSPAARGYQFGDESGPIFWKGMGSVPHDVTDASPTMWHGAGAMVSTLPDVVKLVRAIAEERAVGPTMRAEMYQWVESGYPGVDYRYGFGLVNYEGTIGHAGQVPGYSVSMAFSPEHDLAVVALANSYSSPNWEEPANAVFFVVMRHFTGKSYAPPGWRGW